MKILNVKNLAFVFAIAAAAALFSSCQDVIYYNIRKEVKLKDSSIKADIRSIIRYKDDFYCANGNIYRKSNTSNSYGTWSKTGAPSGQVIKLAADKDYIYALVGISKDSSKDGENIPVRRELWCSSDGSSWSKVTAVYGSGDIAYSSSSRTYLFGTNAIKEENRKAYFILIGGAPGNRAYELSGATSVGVLDWSTTNADTKPTTSSQSCVYDGSAVRFFNSTGSCTNESSSGGDATIYYYGDGSTLRWGGAKTGSVGDGQSFARALGLSVEQTHDYVVNEINGIEGLEVQYFSIVDGDSLADVASWDDASSIVGCITVFCGSKPIRLIDHIRYK